MASKRPALGKGLSALITDNSVAASGQNGFIPNLPIEVIVPNPYQPRAEMNPDKLVELADSIREHGVIEPLLVTKKGENTYELIAGERRWRASQLAGVKFVPVVIKEATPQDMLELAVIENLQREDLNPLEEAMAFEQLYTTFNMTHDKISKRVGISRPAVANKIRLLALPDEIKKGLLEDKVSEGHARALLSLKTKEDMIAAYKKILKDNLSVRAVEELVRRLNKGQMKDKKRTNRILDDRTLTIEKDLKTKFGDSVTFFRSKLGGKITIPFKNEDELDNLMNKLV
ncbi:ParB/RepB/Spo0J family partition protein [Candidatus Dojkabacteria bacterium]|uniref:ParB/RepB/Spo0J family partition protein n=1 Tax=Candidatus Dojkabacteria bacterium TaxID=2099670 RepID=A0A955RLM4_9BACT|nr:ParB/RepB/Spo0J family partition protein [Candidatus Dojkabacteria bacterium]